jgi:DNA invertase Pin-like site-specific DNA recombinase
MYQAGIYCRISIEEQNKEGEYSNSIHSQIQMARDYIAENKDIAEKKVYVDDGASGSNFERTEFRRMLADIELGVINMVIFKDVSRLGREHIDTNYYLGKYFPEKQIRIVSILDNYDSAVGTYDEMLEIKTLLNDMYLRDTSRKIKTTIQTKAFYICQTKNKGGDCTRHSIPESTGQVKSSTTESNKNYSRMGRG